MSKKVILLEDQPKRLGTIIDQFKKYHNVEVSEILYYNPADVEENKLKELVGRLGVSVTKVDLWNFNEIMDERFQQQDTIFIFDTQIFPGEEKEIFDYRINISYALKKKGEGRIWFYTAAGQYYETNITSRFPGYVIGIKCMGEDEFALKLEECSTFMDMIKAQN